MPTPNDAVPYSVYLGLPAPFMDYVGLRTYVADDGRQCMTLRLERRHLNVAASAHGGVILTLLDVAMASAGRRHEGAQGRVCVTVEMKTSFLRPAGAEGEFIEAHGIVRHVTESLAFCDGELRGENGDLLATASGTFRYVKVSKGSDG